MVKKFWLWILRVIAEHVLFQLLAVPAFAYAIGWAIAIRQGTEAAFSNIPPLFWPIVVGLIIIVTFYPAFVAPVIKWCKESRARAKAKENILRASIENAYIKFRNVCEPKTLNPTNPGNPYFMAADARDYANLIRPLLQDAKLFPPERCTIETSSLKKWFNYLGKVRAMDRWIELTYRAGGTPREVVSTKG